MIIIIIRKHRHTKYEENHGDSNSGEQYLLLDCLYRISNCNNKNHTQYNVLDEEQLLTNVTVHAVSSVWSFLFMLPPPML